MRKVTLLLFLAFILVVVSCKQDLDIYYSNTYEYAGRFHVASFNEQNEKIGDIDNDDQVWIYSTAKDLKDDIIIEDRSKHYVDMRSTFSIVGPPSDFSSTSLAYDDLHDDYNGVINALSKSQFSLVEEENKTVTVTVEVLRAAVIEGKILKGAITTKHGNILDSLYLKLKIYGGDVSFTSVKKEKDGIVSYSWANRVIQPKKNLEKIIILAGRRVSGFPEEQIE